MAGLFNFDPNDPRIAAAVMGTNVSAPMGIDANPTPAQTAPTDPGALQQVPDATVQKPGLFGGLLDKANTQDTNGMNFWDKLGAFSQSLHHAQGLFDGTGGDGPDPGIAMVQKFRDQQTAAAQRQQIAALGKQLFPTDARRAALFALKPEAFTDEIAKAVGANQTDKIVDGSLAVRGQDGGLTFHQAPKYLDYNGQFGTRGPDGVHMTDNLGPTYAEQETARHNKVDEAQSGDSTAIARSNLGLRGAELGLSQQKFGYDKQKDAVSRNPGAVPVSNDADFARLPPGTSFVTPDGRVGTKAKR
jgi:hypothetical protein